MDDSELEATLRRYRAAGPRADLRERILAAPKQRIWPWAAAAAALLIATQMLNFASRYEVAEASEALGPGTETRVKETLTEMLGGDAPARELAELIVFEQQVRSEMTTMPTELDIAGEGEHR